VTVFNFNTSVFFFTKTYLYCFLFRNCLFSCCIFLFFFTSATSFLYIHCFIYFLPKSFVFSLSLDCILISSFILFLFQSQLLFATSSLFVFKGLTFCFEFGDVGSSLPNLLDQLFTYIKSHSLVPLQVFSSPIQFLFRLEVKL